jgi:hypothetical protein
MEVPMTLRIAMSLTLLASLSLQADPPPGKGKDKGSKHAEGVPPGLAKKGGLPPGLAKKYGPKAPKSPYIAFDPRYEDRAWFLIDGHWELQKGFTGSLKVEVRDSLRLPAAPPPVPLPKVGVDLHVVLFN